MATGEQHELLFIPLDDRPVTRDAVLELAAAAGISVRTPERALLGTRDRGADVHALWSWILRQVEGPDRPPACIASIEMLCFGGLVAARRSTRHWRNILPWLDRVYEMAARVPTYLSAIIPRTPVYSGGSEDPEYWKTYGEALRAYSAATDEFAWMGGAVAAQRVAEALGQIPAEVLEAVLQHRRRHLLLNTELLIAATGGRLRTLLIGQDDTTGAGLSRLDGEGLERLARISGAPNTILTTGADELGAVLFARWLNDSRGVAPEVRVVYTFPHAMDRVPTYESQPLAESVREHVEAAGCRVGTGAADILLWVHNFEEQRQVEAPHQDGDWLGGEARTTATRLIREAARGQRPVALADVRYANGGDRALAAILLHTHNAGNIAAYAGWNTASNAVGSAVAQAVTAYHARRESPAGALDLSRRVLLSRLLDDWGYQAVVRPRLADWVRMRGGDPESLGGGESAAEEEASRLFGETVLPVIESCIRQPVMLHHVTFPWHRLFEAAVEYEIGQRDPSGEPVVIAAYDSRWPAMFAEEAERLGVVLRGFEAAIEHVGSTAVPGLGAKPTIDILVGLQHEADLDRCIDPIQRSGYIYVPQYEVELPDRRYFGRGPWNRAYHLHVVVRGGEFWQRHLLFRDHLRTHADAAREYERLKRELAAKYGADRVGYTDAKTEFIRSVDDRARREIR